ncbi:sushi, nidogen and EGF-like domain-containing protein 1 [Colossoma macropomum]|uniref:sushi, nidogen and EGF-like domain-containing protein 1 n=1 Tax=Colossoma macropomum TaxID=42526 RepID=UPI00186447C9|nr:sushi, nidogen and EGF-like domain-containing protein 1 [Colossoma macropomum]
MRIISVILLFSFTAVSPLSDLFYPHGKGKGDTLNVQDDIRSPAVTLQSPFSFFGHTYSQIYVYKDGLLKLSQKQFVSGGDIFFNPSLTCLDNSKGGVISYNQYSEGSVLSRATQDINQYFPEVTFAASWVFVVTWDGVPYCGHPGKASFQVVFISRGTLSFMLINYSPTNPTNQYVKAGYNTTKHSFQILMSASSISNLIKTSNVNVPGRWAFWVNQGSITPLPAVDA